MSTDPQPADGKPKTRGTLFLSSSAKTHALKRLAAAKQLEPE